MTTAKKPQVQRLPVELELRASEYEEQFVASLLVAAEWAADEQQSLWGVQPDDLRDRRWRAIFEAVRSLISEGRRPSYVAVCHQLTDAGALKMVGGASEVTRLISIAHSFVLLPDLAARIMENSVRRAILTASGQAAALALDGDASVAVQEATRILQVAARRNTSVSTEILRPGSSQELVYQAVDELRRLAQENRLVVWDTPWIDVNRMIGSFRAGHLFTLAGYPGHGKTTMFGQIAEHNAQKGARVAFFHAEHQHRWILFRRIMRLTGAHVYDLERGQCMEQAMEAEEIVNTWVGGIYYIHCPGWGAERIVQTMRDLHAVGGCDLAIVDYLQKLDLGDKSWNRADLLGNAVETIKTAGEQLRIPVLLGSQLNRAGYHASRPGLEHLRGSGEIAEKANYCAFVYRDKVGERELSSTAEVYQEKPYAPGCELYFNPDRLAFYSATREPLNL